MKYFITGATGFIGPHLVQKLVSEGHRCRCLVRDEQKAGPIASLGAECIVGDITRPDTFQGAAEGMDCVLHLATLGHMSNFTVTESMFEAINVQGTLNIMAEALHAKVPRIVHCSSVAAMGICPEIPATEQTPCRPHHAYGRSKLKAENAVREMIHTKDLPAVIVRFSMVYGPGDWRDMLKLTRLAKKGLFPKIGDKKKLTPLIHVSDAIQGLLLASEKGRIGETYLLTNRESMEFDAIRKTLTTALGVRRFPLYVPQWVALTGASMVEKAFGFIGKAPPVTRKNIESTLADRIFSIDKARKELDFNPEVEPKQGLMQTVKWYREKGWV